MTKTENKLREAMKLAGTYKEQYEMQISETASAIDERARMQKLVSQEGMTIIERGVKDQEKRVAHPLLAVINNYHRTITQQLTALGLNMLKKSQDEPETQLADKMAEFFQK